jgi:Ni,Fe-hydrogenase maturation factor
MPIKILFLGYGNIDRQDDGIAWHILNLLSEQFGKEIRLIDSLGFSPTDSGVSESGSNILPESVSTTQSGDILLDLTFTLQLAPEIAEFLSGYSEVCFIDAHTGSIPADIQFIDLESGFQASPFTHHLTPQSCLALTQTIFGHAPRGHLLSVRGFEFGFDQNLSVQADRLIHKAADRIFSWLSSEIF